MCNLHKKTAVGVAYIKNDDIQNLSLIICAVVFCQCFSLHPISFLMCLTLDNTRFVLELPFPLLSGSLACGPMCNCASDALPPMGSCCGEGRGLVLLALTSCHWVCRTERSSTGGWSSFAFLSSTIVIS